MSDERTIHYVDALISALGREADQSKERFAKLTRVPRVVPDDCRALWHETAFAFIFGQYGAALITCCAFVERLLSRSIEEFEKTKETPSRTVPIDIGPLINRARNIGLITKEEQKELDGFRKYVRNVIAHGNTKELADSMYKVLGVQTGYCTRW